MGSTPLSPASPASPASVPERLPSPTPRAAAFVFVFITVALDMLALGVMIPVLPKLIIQFEGGNVADAAGAAGLFGFSWAAMQFVFSPLLGAISDRHGRRPVILLSNLGLGLDYLLMAVAPSLSWLFVGRLISGITSASYSTAAAYIADVTPEEERAAKFGMLGAAFGLGFVVGPAIGGLLGGVSLRLPFYVAAGLSLANALYGFFILPESLPKEKRAAFAWSKANPVGSLALLRSHPRLLGLTLVAFLYNVAHDSLPSVFVLYTDYRYHWGERLVGFCLAAVGIASTIVSALLIGPVVKRLGERRALLIGLTFGVLGFALYGWAPTGSWFLAGIPLIAIWGLSAPAFQALMSRRVGATEQGRLQGALASMSGITGMVGPLLFTQVFAFGISSQTLHLPGAPFWTSSWLLCASLLVAWLVARDARKVAV